MASPYVQINSKPLPTLTLQGWVSDVGKQLDLAIAYCCVSYGSQGSVFTGVLSFAKIIHDFGQDFDGMCNKMQTDLGRYLSGIFDSSEVEVYHDARETEGSGVTISVRAVVTVNGVEYNSKMGLEVENSKIAKYFSLNETHEAY